jgi:hypothetical protein
VDLRTIDEYRKLKERLLELATEAAMEGVALEVPLDPEVAELKRMFALEPHGTP